MRRVLKTVPCALGIVLCAFVFIPIFPEQADAQRYRPYRAPSYNNNAWRQQQLRQQQLQQQQLRQQQLRQQQQQLQRQRALQQQRIRQQRQAMQQRQQQAAARRAQIRQQQEAARRANQQRARQAKDQAAAQRARRNAANLRRQRIAEQRRRDLQNTVLLLSSRRSASLSTTPNAPSLSKRLKSASPLKIAALTSQRQRIAAAALKLRKNKQSQQKERAKLAQNRSKPKARMRSCAGSSACDQCSFHADTPILTDSGYIPIHRIVAGKHLVFAKSELSGAVGWKPVTSHYSNEYSETVRITIRNTYSDAVQTIRSNRIHPFFLTNRVAATQVSFSRSPQGKWVDAQHLRVGDKLFSASGEPVLVEQVAIEPRALKAFNLTVADYHTYFVGGSGASAWVHNDCPIPRLNEKALRKSEREILHSTLGKIRAGNTSGLSAHEYQNRKADGASLPKLPVGVKYVTYTLKSSDPRGLNTYRIIRSSDGKHEFYSRTHYGDNKKYQIEHFIGLNR